METILVSVIVPVYNVCDYLKNCLESIIKQTYNDLEIIIIDDGSTDTSGEICDEYQKKDKRIQVIHTDNRGLSIARNTGIEISQGKYICFVDSDDFISKYYVEEMLKVAIKTDSDIVICEWNKYRQNSYVCDEVHEISDDDIEYLSEKYLYDQEFIINKTMKLSYAWNKMIKREVISDIRFPEGRYYEDAAVYYMLLDKSSRTAMISSKLYYYRVDNNSITRSKYSEKKCKDLLDTYKERIEFYIRKGNQRLIEIAWDSYLYEIWSCERKMREEGLNTNIVDKYKVFLKKYFWKLKISKTFSFNKYIRMFYIAYLK